MEQNLEIMLRLQSKVTILETKVEYLEKTGLSRQEHAEMVKELILLKASIEEIKNNREEDRQVIGKLDGKIQGLEELIRDFVANTVEIKGSQAQVVTSVDNVNIRMNNLENKIDKIMELMNFNWVEIVKNFINYNIFTKVFSYFSLISIIILVIEMILYYIGIPVNIKKMFGGS